MIETTYGSFELAAVLTHGQRRELAAYRASVWSMDAGVLVTHPSNLMGLCRKVEALLDDDGRAKISALEPDTANAACIELAHKLIEGVSGKGLGA
jgi:hypothetical protein